MRADGQFQQVAHCGGIFSITIETDPNTGERRHSSGLQHSSPTPASFFLIYALPSGIPIYTVPTIGLGGDGAGVPNLPLGFHVMISSDTHGYFGHRCSRCKAYWRSKSAPAYWRMTCPYCGEKGYPHQFLTDGQNIFVAKFCSEAEELLYSDFTGTREIDLDKIADEVAKGMERPDFYYAEETQQRKFKCLACGDINDITGIYGYCSCCATRSELDLFVQEVAALRVKLRETKQTSSVLCDLVSAFDSAFRQYLRQLIAKVPVTSARMGRLNKLSGHNIASCSKEFETIFGIKILDGIASADLLIRSFQRRHVYEHNGGVVDAEYLSQSGDQTVRLHEYITENMTDVFLVADMTVRVLQNVHAGFHDILVPERKPIEYEESKRKRQREESIRGR